MKARIIYLLHRIRESFWFIPIIMMLAAFGLSHGALYADQATALGAIAKRIWFGALDEESARLILSTVTGAMITTASLVFSLTLVSLTLASQQLGPRLMSMFLRDRMTQTVLGLFLATFVYALIVLMALGGDDGPVLVPMLSITIAVTSTIASFVALIMFIHHLSTSLQADVVVARVSTQLKEQINRSLPLKAPDGAASAAVDDVPEINGRTIPTTGCGYIQAVDHKALLDLATEHDLQLRLLRGAGDFLAEGDSLAVVSPKSMDSDVYGTSLHKAVVYGEKRTATQDIEFSLMAIVEIALRALSPGINDPHTAKTCIDRISEAMVMLFMRTLRSNSHYDDSHTLRLVTRESTIEDLMGTAFNEIRQCASNSVPVLIRLCEAQERLGARATTEAQSLAVRAHLDMIERCADANIKEPGDRENFNIALKRARSTLKARDNDA